MRVAIAQVDPVVGAFEANVKKINEVYKRACQEQARLLLTPELALCGYPPHDLIERPEMFERNERALKDLLENTKAKACALAVGHVAANPSLTGRAAQNVVSVLENGKLVFRQAKMLLPTYDVFDEARYFEPAREVQLWNCDGHAIAMAICEDLWAHDPSFGRQLYGQDPVQQYERLGARAVLAISASPYAWGKRERRELLHGEVAKRLKIPLVYVNQTGATDEILFDGASFALNSNGTLIGRMPFFKTGFGWVDIPLEADAGKKAVAWNNPDASSQDKNLPDEIELLYRALITGIREYFVRTGFKSAVLGLSGGIDSALVAVLAAQALGPENVLGIAMPSQYSSSHSLEDAQALARNLKIRFEVRPIKFLFSTASREFSEGRGHLASIALENLQSRLRGLIVMTLSNHDRSLILATTNKSELATGYGTLYGDMAGALAPLGDVFKTRVYELARYINQVYGNPIPERCLTKAPSAELKPGQTDQDTLPPYETLDSMLMEYIENRLSVQELEKKFKNSKGVRSPQWIRETLRLLEINEFKRRQAPPVIKTSVKAFGIGRRIPLAKTWDQ